MVVTTEPADKRLRHQIPARKVGKDRDFVLRTEQNTSTGRGDSAWSMISITI